MSIVTIKDVAKMANVSISTVSRVINNNYPVSKDVRERVERVIEKSGYSANALAGSLRSNNTRLIAIAIPGVAHVSFMELVDGLQRVTDAHGCTLVVVNTGNDEEEERKGLEDLMRWRISGLVIAPSAKEPSMVKKLMASGVKVVVVDRDIKGFFSADRVMWENYYSSRQAIRHFIEMGHKRIAIICAPNEFNVGVERLMGYLDELSEHGIEVPEYYYSNRNSTMQEACDSAKALMQCDNPPTAYLCNSYFCTRGLLKASCELNLKIPDDLSVINFSRFDFNDYFEPKITTIEQDICKMGEIAGELLFERFEDETRPPQEIVVKADLVKRDSVKKLN